MKKLLFLLTFLLGTAAVHAENYTYLTFETTDGAKISVEVSSLNISFSGTNLIAGEQTFALSNLSKMYFSSSNETTGIKSLTDEELENITEVYDLNGRQLKLSNTQELKNLPPGVYVIKGKSGTYKIAVK